MDPAIVFFATIAALGFAGSVVAAWDRALGRCAGWALLSLYCAVRLNLL